ncbi:hypothetical protein BKA70DRAFT_346612 [Coprinopsis sp. MPI-PUGE-AT-0042]|nr:hypothetical protein BKA70DRAFT_346612 [Coprinopsis sp. MPI-PUGE-AT-0042]
MNPDLSFLCVQVEDQPDITLDLLKRFASLDLEPTIFAREGKLPASVSRYPPILSSPKTCHFDAPVRNQVLYGIGFDSVSEAAQPVLRWKTAGTIERKCIARCALDAPYNLVFPGNLRRSEETLEDVHRTSGGQRKPGDSATRVHLVASCEPEG